MSKHPMKQQLKFERPPDPKLAGGRNDTIYVGSDCLPQL